MTAIYSGFDFSMDTDDDGIPDGCNDICIDANGDREINIGNAVFLVNYMFNGGGAPDLVGKGDASGDCDSKGGDAVYMIAYAFEGGPALIKGCSDWPLNIVISSPNSQSFNNP